MQSRLFLHHHQSLQQKSLNDLLSIVKKPPNWAMMPVKKYRSS